MTFPPFEAGSLDHFSAVSGFVQVFLGTAVIVLFGCWLKARLFPSTPQPHNHRKMVKRSTAMRPNRPMQGRRARPVLEAGSGRPASPLPAALHWQRACAPLGTFIAHGERARELHAEASVRLDAADYAIRRLLSELGPVLGLPQRRAPQLALARPAASVTVAAETPLAA